MGRNSRRIARPQGDAASREITARCEIEAPLGLEAFLHAELTRLPKGTLATLPPQPLPESGALRVQCRDLRPLLTLNTAIAAYLVQTYPIPRPKGLLGHQYFTQLLQQIQNVRALHPPNTFKTIYLSAAGSHSSIMQRIQDDLATHTGLQIASHEGDLLLRLRPAPDGEGWQSLIRLTPRPFVTRFWRVCNFEGALNAAIARSMIELTQPAPHDTFLNLTCGSGSLLIERLLAAPAQRALGIDLDPLALTCARENLRAAGKRAASARLLRADAAQIPLPVGSVTALAADLPFGHLVGSHAQNLQLYPRLLHESARVAQNGARFALITHEVRLTENLLNGHPQWQIEGVWRVTQGGLHPRIFLLKKRP